MKISERLNHFIELNLTHNGRRITNFIPILKNSMKEERGEIVLACEDDIDLDLSLKNNFDYSRFQGQEWSAILRYNKIYFNRRPDYNSNEFGIVKRENFELTLENKEVKAVLRLIHENKERGALLILVSQSLFDKMKEYEVLL